MAFYAVKLLLVATPILSQALVEPSALLHGRVVTYNLVLLVFKGLTKLFWERGQVPLFP